MIIKESKKNKAQAKMRSIESKMKYKIKKSHIQNAKEYMISNTMSKITICRLKKHLDN